MSQSYGPRDEFLLLTRLPTSASHSLSQQAPEPPAPHGSGAVPLCSHAFCQREATNGDLCEPHADLMKDLREEYYELQREFEAGW